MTVIVLCLATSAAVIILTSVLQGNAPRPQQIVRFTFTVVLCYFLYRRQNWARWFFGVLLILGGVLSLFASFSVPSGLAGTILATLGSAYGGMGCALLLSPGVREYFTRPPEPQGLARLGDEIERANREEQL